MDAAALGTLLRSAKHDLFRLETLDSYADDAASRAAYLAGEPGPDLAVIGPWLERLRAEHARGLRRRRVHVVRSPVGDAVRHECEWCYVPNAEAGEDIRILDLAEHSWRGLFLDQDFWVVDGATVVLMRYDSAGVFLGADTVTGLAAAVYLSASDTAWGAAEPFAAWWARHPQYHRGRKAA